MTEESPLVRLLGIEALSETLEKTLARLVVRMDHRVWSIAGRY